MAHLPRTMTAAETKAHFAECLRAAEEGAEVVITRHGKPVAALVSSDELERIRTLRAAGPEKGLAGLAGGLKGAAEYARILTDIQQGRARRSRKPR